jgi:hypothetical protein
VRGRSVAPVACADTPDADTPPPGFALLPAPLSAQWLTGGPGCSSELALFVEARTPSRTPVSACAPLHSDAH